MPFVDGSASIQLNASVSGEGRMVYNVDARLGLAAAIRGPVRASPRVASAVTLSPGLVRVTFDQQMAVTSGLTRLASYALAPTGGGAPIFVSSVTPQSGVTYPTYVDIRTTEQTTGASYGVTVASGAAGPQSRYAMSMNTVGLVAFFVGAGIAPTIASVAAVGQNRVDIRFDEPMLDNAALRDVSRYTFDGGLSVVSILEVVSDTVRLVTSDQTPGQLYTLTIT